MGYHTGLDSVHSKARPVVLPDRIIQVTEETFQIVKEHSFRYYSTATYDEILVNLVKFYQENQGPSHKQDD